MKTFLASLLVLMLCHLCTAQNHSINNNIFPQVPYYVENGEAMAETQKPRTEEGEEELALQSDIWLELRDLRDMVVELRLELRQLTVRVTATDSQVEALQKENAAMEARMTAAETLAEELQMENDAQATELAEAQQKLSSIQDRVTVSERHVQELEKQQEGQNVAVQELQNTNRVRKVAFSTSLLASGEGTTSSNDFVQLIFRNIFTNIGNHYNQHTGYFTAPLRGVYYFRFTGHLAQSETTIRMRLVKNGHAIVFAGDSADLEDNVSNGAVLQLEVGDVVSVQSAGDVWDDQYHRTTFSGFLLFPL